MFLKKLLANRKLLVISIILALLVIGFFVYQKLSPSQDSLSIEEMDLVFDAEGPFALMIPRRDGNAVNLSLKRTSSYDKISYELAYTSQPDDIKAGSGDEVESGGVDRGVVGDVKTDQKKGEYEQEVLFGTCSKNVCKYDKGVENGTLTLHIQKGKQAYKMVTQWHLQQPDVALGVLTSGDGHFTYKITALRQDLALVGYTIINDLSGLPKLSEGRSVVRKVYSLNVPLAKTLQPGEVKISLAEKPDPNAKIERYDLSRNEWKQLETKIDGSNLTASADGVGIFAVLTPKK